MAEKEIVLINKSKGKFTINFLGAFPINKSAPKGGKLYLTEREFEWLQANSPHILDGESKRLYRKDELEVEAEVMSNEKFFSQHHAKIKSAIAEMNAEEAQMRYDYAQLHNVSKGVLKALEDRILELDKKD